jgi:hypothetical protein
VARAALTAACERAFYPESWVRKVALFPDAGMGR